jgi:hypothetical protein
MRLLLRSGTTLDVVPAKAGTHSRRSMVGARTVLAACLAAVLSLLSPLCLSAEPLTIAVADFDYVDTSGEVKDQRAEHKARVAKFAELVRARKSFARRHTRAAVRVPATSLHAGQHGIR